MRCWTAWSSGHAYRSAAVEESGETEHVYGQFRYKTKKTWKYKRRILYKAEKSLAHPNRDPKDNPRFVITNMKQSPQWLYEEVYCQRGDLENRIKELHYGMEIGRTSCTSFLGQSVPRADDRRGLRTVAGAAIASGAHGLRRAQVSTLRERFLKLGVQVIATVRRVVLHLPQAFPYRDSFHRLALSLGAPNWLSSPAALPREFLLVTPLVKVSLFASKSGCEPR